MFSQASVILSKGGGENSKDVCVAGIGMCGREHVWQRGQRGHAWLDGLV